MRIDAEIIAVRTTGEKLIVTMQGKSPSDGEWLAMTEQTVSIRADARTQKTFYVGRLVRIEVTAL